MKKLQKNKIERDIAMMYDTPAQREETAGVLFSQAVTAKRPTEDYWRRMKAYYDGRHDTARQTGSFLSCIDLPWTPAVVPDAYLHVESQIDSRTPDFEFAGRGEGDDAHAREREKVVRYVCDINDMERKNAQNERRLNLYGSAVWKLSVGLGEDGDAEIIIDDPSPECIFTDPCAVSVDDCEYIVYTYKMSATKAERMFAADLKKEQTSISKILEISEKSTSALIYESGNGNIGDVVDITEFWFRQPCDGICEAADNNGHTYIYSYKAGDIALSIFIGGREIRYIPKFWENSGCNKFPFVIYNKIPSDDSVWGKSEIEQIIPLIDAADRQLAFAQLNTAFSANDIVVCEENAFSPDSYPDNRPGAVWKLRPGMIDKVSRLGGLAGDGIGHYEIVEKYRALMKESLGNYDFLQGDSTTQVTTATGLALLSDFANKRVNAKNTCKKAGFVRLYQLIDYLALEVYGREKLGAIGIDIGDFPADSVDYINAYGYVPRLDVKVFVGDGLEYSRSYTLSALKSLSETTLTKENYPVVREYIRAIQIPECASLIEELDRTFANENEGVKA
ncbi:MAG: hypothetical protein IJR55_00740 [Clostridia bacterium]|nr:hypothetical protein [Clostridia bacterium]